MTIPPKYYKYFFSLYPPYLGAGIRIEEISSDWREITVSMKANWYNKNIMGTHFGGSLYSMVDPHLMLQLIKILGDNYRIWDKAADIDFIKATDKRVRCHCVIKNTVIEKIINKTQSGEKYFPEFHLEIKDDDNNVIATVKKVIYVRKKKQH